MRAMVSNSMGKRKLKLNDVRDQILAKEVYKIDSSEGTSSSSALNLKNRVGVAKRVLIGVVRGLSQGVVKTSLEHREHWSARIVARMTI